jgi:hypothetical protein
MSEVPETFARKVCEIINWIYMPEGNPAQEQALQRLWDYVCETPNKKLETLKGELE